MKPSPGEIFSGLSRGSNAGAAPRNAPSPRRRGTSGTTPNPFKNPNFVERAREARPSGPGDRGRPRRAPDAAPAAYTREAEAASAARSATDAGVGREAPVAARRPAARGDGGDAGPGPGSAGRGPGGGEREERGERRGGGRRGGAERDEFSEAENRRYDPEDRFAPGVRRRAGRADAEETPWRGPTATFHTADSFLVGAVCLGLHSPRRLTCQALSSCFSPCGCFGGGIGFCLPYASGLFAADKVLQLFKSQEEFGMRVDGTSTALLKRKHLRQLLLTQEKRRTLGTVILTQIKGDDESLTHPRGLLALWRAWTFLTRPTSRQQQETLLTLEERG